MVKVSEEIGEICGFNILTEKVVRIDNRNVGGEYKKVFHVG